MATATAEKKGTVEAQRGTAEVQKGSKIERPLMKFRLLSGGFDQVDPTFSPIRTSELRRRVLAKRGITNLEDEDSKAELSAVNGMTRPELLRELGAFQRFRANADTGEQPIIESNIDLVKKFGRLKFDTLSSSDQQRERVVERKVYLDLAEADEADLRAYAAEEEIDLAGCNTKQDMLATIRSAKKK